jgi:putative cardiolipin synthase
MTDLLLPGRITARACGVLLLGVALAGCTSMPVEHQGVPSEAFTSVHETSLGRAVAESAARHPGQSGFRLLDTGAEAFRTRAALATLAERTLDAQYFIWNGDTMGRLLGGMLLEAAERGVRVRLLVDDFYIDGRDERVALFNAHPNIQVRVFNPLSRRGSGIARLLGFVSDFRRLNHRMHNKLFIADGTFVVAGGRNVGDEYYGVDPEFNMRDRDMLATGPVVSELGKSFDSFWNSPWAVPFEAVVDTPADPDEATALQAQVLSFAHNPPALPFPVRFTASELEAAVARVVKELIWAEAEVHYDLPEPEDGDTDGENYARVGNAIGRLVGGAREEVLIQTPYLIPKPRGVAAIETLRSRGVSLKVMTNSLASTDMVPAQAAYARWRQQMLQRGAEVFELRPDASLASRFVHLRTEPAPALTLHAKSMVIDREIVYVGTYNLDRRSASLNTEVALVVRSAELAERIARDIEADMRPENSWRVLRRADGGTVWVGSTNGEEQRHEQPPGAGFGRGVGAGLMGLLPIDEHL